MTPAHTYTVAVIGGTTVAVVLVLFTVLAIGIYLTASRLIEARDTRREHRRALADFRDQLNTLPTTHHPDE
ncbi:hypothetical protein ABZX40_36460 [Streptomyces sp. NPDC004610]|uniref:hypothetical protein n=1 Tax=unclassified Streptomyces TaxID=2593676 RepID=UPI0033A94699